MKLTLMERFSILGILPQHGNIITLRIIQDLRRNLSPTEEEISKCNIQVDPVNNVTTWTDMEYAVDVPIGEKAFDEIVRALNKCDKEGTLTEQHIPIFEKFVEGKAEPDAKMRLARP